MAYSRTTWVDYPDLSTLINATRLNNIESGLVTADANASAAIPKSTVTTAGDIVYATGSAAVTRLGIGATSTVLTGGGSAPSWALPPGYEYSYVAKTSDTSITATTSATANTVVTAGAVSFDGSTLALLEFWCPFVAKGTNNINVEFWDAAALGGAIGITGAVAPLGMKWRLTPSNASHTFSVRAWVDAGTGTVKGGAGGAGVNLSAFIRVTKV